MAISIEERQFKDFGTFLKDYDFDNSGYIKTDEFFRCLESLFNEQLGKGDVIDLIDRFDQNKLG